jgi:capsular exopolysaccharide synthesis family protein
MDHENALQKVDQESIILEYLNLLKKRSMVIVSFISVLLVTSFVATLFATERYKASSTIEILPFAPSVMGSASEDDVSSMGAESDSAMRIYYGTMYAILSSKKVLNKTIERLHQEYDIHDFQGEDGYRLLKRSLSIAPKPDTTLTTISIEHTNPETAAIIANVLASVFFDLNLDRALEPVRDALKFLEREHERYREAKLTSDERVHEFKYENHLVGIEQRANATMTNMLALQEALTKIQSERIQVEAEYNARIDIVKNGNMDSMVNEFAARDRLLSSLLSSQSRSEQTLEALRVRYTDKHPQVVAELRQLNSLNQRIDEEIQGHLEAKKTELELILARERGVSEELARAESEVKELDRKLIELQFLLGEAARNQALYMMLDKRMSEVDLSQFMQANNIRFVDPAEAEYDPVYPNPIKNLIVALVMGLMGGIGLAFIVEYLDNTVKSKEDLESLLGVPLLGVVPAINAEEMLSLSSIRDRSLFVFSQPRSTVSEALRSIRTNVLFRLGGGVNKTLLVTSSVPKEGKSFMSSNLSAVLAMGGHRVILVDADLRRPSLHNLFELSDEVGLSEVLAGTRTLESVIQPTHIPNLHLITAGPIPPNPSELLGSETMLNVKRALNDMCDILIIDSSPVTAVADPVILSHLVDGVVLVVEANSTKKPIVMQTVTRLQQVQAKIIGGVVNKLDLSKSGYGYYYYYSDYSYYTDDEYQSRGIS